MPEFYHITSTMQLDNDSCYPALLSRDTRFDGVFYVAVSSTKIYCRPVCRVKTPLKKNCRFFISAAAAEHAGYRPCLKCRPEIAPGTSTMEASERLAHLAFDRIEAGALKDGSLADLADEFGVTDRHLRRVFESAFGVSPIAVAQTRRLHLTKQLLTDTKMPLTDIAYASGFKSLRRFNALFKSRYRLNPGTFRRTTQETSGDVLVAEVSFRPPLDWPALLAFLRARAAHQIEKIGKNHYSRTVAIENYRGVMHVTPVSNSNRLRIQISSTLAPVLVPLIARTKKLFDLAANPAAITAKNPGLRVPGAFDTFEVAVRAILGQQISVKAATTLAGRFVTRFGEPIETGEENLTLLSPTATRVANAKVSEIAALGIVPKRAETILNFSRALARKQISLEPQVDIATQIDSFMQLDGIGEWTANYIAMRCLSWPDAFLATDLVVMKALGTKNKNEILRQAEAWRPWRSYALMEIWRNQ